MATYKSKYKRFLRTLALALVVCLGVQDFALAAPDPGHGLLLSMPGFGRGLALPESVAAVERVQGPGDPRVFLIRDAHTNPSAQFNTARVLEHLVSRDDLRTVLTEGGAGDLSVSFLKKYGTPAERLQTASAFLRRGEINGAEFLQITSDGPRFDYRGVEDDALYERSLSNYQAVTKQRDGIRRELAEIRTSIDFFKSRLFGRDLAFWVERREKFERGEITLAAYWSALTAEAAARQVAPADMRQLQRLREVLRLESRVDAARAAEELERVSAAWSPEDREEARRIFGGGNGIAKSLSKSSGESSAEMAARGLWLKTRLDGSAKAPNLRLYCRYLNSLNKLNPRELMDQAARVEESLLESLADSAGAKGLLDAIRAERFYRRLYDFALMPEEIDHYRQHPNVYDMERVLGFLNREVMKAGGHAERAIFLDPVERAAYPKAVEFYELTQKRDEAFVRETLKNLETQSVKKCALITGGYHTPHLEELLKRNGITYAVITPRVYEATDQVRYEKILFRPMTAPTSTLMPPAVRNTPILFALGARLGASESEVRAAMAQETGPALGKITEIAEQKKPAAAARMAEKGREDYGARMEELMKEWRRKAYKAWEPGEASLLRGSAFSDLHIGNILNRLMYQDSDSGFVGAKDSLDGYFVRGEFDQARSSELGVKEFPRSVYGAPAMAHPMRMVLRERLERPLTSPKAIKRSHEQIRFVRDTGLHRDPELRKKLNRVYAHLRSIQLELRQELPHPRLLPVEYSAPPGYSPDDESDESGVINFFKTRLAAAMHLARLVEALEDLDLDLRKRGLPTSFWRSRRLEYLLKHGPIVSQIRENFAGIKYPDELFPEGSRKWTLALFYDRELTDAELTSSDTEGASKKIFWFKLIRMAMQSRDSVAGESSAAVSDPLISYAAKIGLSTSKESIEAWKRIADWPNRFYEALGELEFAIGGANMLDEGYSFANTDKGSGRIRVTDGWNPVAGRRADMDPISVEIGGDGQPNLLAVTGENEVGKSTTTEMLALIIWYHEHGLPVPAAFADISIFKRIFTLTPSAQSVRDTGESHHTEFVKRVQAIAADARPGDLVLIDEGHMGSDYKDLVAITTVVMRDLAQKGVTVLYTTHLKEVVERLSRLMPDRIRAVKVMRPKRGSEESANRRSVRPGVADTSNATATLRRAGFPQNVTLVAAMFNGALRSHEWMNVSDLAYMRAAAADLRRADGPMTPIGEGGARAWEDPDATYRMKEAASMGFSKNNPRGIYKKAMSKNNEDLNSEDETAAALFYFYARRANIDLSQFGFINEKLIEYYQPLIRELMRFLSGQPKDWMDQVWRLIDDPMDYEPDAGSEGDAAIADKLHDYFNGLISRVSEMGVQSNDAQGWREDLLNRLDKRRYEVIDEFDLGMSYVDDPGSIDELAKTAFTHAGDTGMHLFFQLYPLQVAMDLVRLEREHPGFTRLQASTDDTLRLHGGLPPFVDQNPVRLDVDIPRGTVLAIIGPNGAGKTRAIQTIDWYLKMARRGLPVPADRFEAPNFRKVWTFIGTQEDMTEGHSYFRSVAEKLGEIVREATSHDLVILDELHGSDYEELSAIQAAVVSYLSARGVTVILNTHMRRSLKTLMRVVPGIQVATLTTTRDPNGTLHYTYSLTGDPKVSAQSWGIESVKALLTPVQYADALAIRAEIESTSPTAAARMAADPRLLVLRGVVRVVAGVAIGAVASVAAALGSDKGLISQPMLPVRRRDEVAAEAASAGVRQDVVASAAAYGEAVEASVGYDSMSNAMMLANYSQLLLADQMRLGPAHRVLGFYLDTDAMFAAFMLGAALRGADADMAQPQSGDDFTDMWPMMDLYLRDFTRERFSDALWNGVQSRLRAIDIGGLEAGWEKALQGPYTHVYLPLMPPYVSADTLKKLLPMLADDATLIVVGDGRSLNPEVAWRRTLFEINETSDDLIYRLEYEGRTPLNYGPSHASEDAHIFKIRRHHRSVFLESGLPDVGMVNDLRGAEQVMAMFTDSDLSWPWHSMEVEAEAIDRFDAGGGITFVREGKAHEVVTDGHPAPLIIRLEDSRNLSGHLFEHGITTMTALQTLESALGRMDNAPFVAVDAGAGSGALTLRLAQDLRASVIYAVEPDPEALTKLYNNLFMNQIPYRVVNTPEDFRSAASESRVPVIVVPGDLAHFDHLMDSEGLEHIFPEGKNVLFTANMSSGMTKEVIPVFQRRLLDSRSVLAARNVWLHLSGMEQRSQSRGMMFRGTNVSGGLDAEFLRRSPMKWIEDFFDDRSFSGEGWRRSTGSSYARQDSELVCALIHRPAETSMSAAARMAVILPKGNWLALLAAAVLGAVTANHYLSSWVIDRSQYLLVQVDKAAHLEEATRFFGTKWRGQDVHYNVAENPGSDLQMKAYWADPAHHTKLHGINFFNAMHYVTGFDMGWARVIKSTFVLFILMVMAPIGFARVYSKSKLLRYAHGALVASYAIGTSLQIADAFKYHAAHDNLIFSISDLFILTSKMLVAACVGLWLGHHYGGLDKRSAKSGARMAEAPVDRGGAGTEATAMSQALPIAERYILNSSGETMREVVERLGISGIYAGRPASDFDPLQWKFRPGLGGQEERGRLSRLTLQELGEALKDMMQSRMIDNFNSLDMGLPGREFLKAFIDALSSQAQSGYLTHHLNSAQQFDAWDRLSPGRSDSIPENVLDKREKYKAFMQEIAARWAMPNLPDPPADLLSPTEIDRWNQMMEPYKNLRNFDNSQDPPQIEVYLRASGISVMPNRIVPTENLALALTALSKLHHYLYELLGSESVTIRPGSYPTDPERTEIDSYDWMSSHLMLGGLPIVGVFVKDYANPDALKRASELQDFADFIESKNEKAGPIKLFETPRDYFLYSVRNFQQISELIEPISTEAPSREFITRFKQPDQQAVVPYQSLGGYFLSAAFVDHPERLALFRQAAQAYLRLGQQTMDALNTYADRPEFNTPISDLIKTPPAAARMAGEQVLPLRMFWTHLERVSDKAIGFVGLIQRSAADRRMRAQIHYYDMNGRFVESEEVPVDEINSEKYKPASPDQAQAVVDKIAEAQQIGSSKKLNETWKGVHEAAAAMFPDERILRPNTQTASDSELYELSAALSPVHPPRKNLFEAAQKTVEQNKRMRDMRASGDFTWESASAIERFVLLGLTSQNKSLVSGGLAKNLNPKFSSARSGIVDKDGRIRVERIYGLLDEAVKSEQIQKWFTRLGAEEAVNAAETPALIQRWILQAIPAVERILANSTPTAPKRAHLRTEAEALGLLESYQETRLLEARKKVEAGAYPRALAKRIEKLKMISRLWSEGNFVFPRWLVIGPGIPKGMFTDDESRELVAMLGIPVINFSHAGFVLPPGKTAEVSVQEKIAALKERYGLITFDILLKNPNILYFARIIPGGIRKAMHASGQRDFELPAITPPSLEKLAGDLADSPGFKSPGFKKIISVIGDAAHRVPRSIEVNPDNEGVLVIYDGVGVVSVWDVWDLDDPKLLFMDDADGYEFLGRAETMRVGDQELALPVSPIQEYQGVHWVKGEQVLLKTADGWHRAKIKTINSKQPDDLTTVEFKLAGISDTAFYRREGLIRTGSIQPIISVPVTGARMAKGDRAKNAKEAVHYRVAIKWAKSILQNYQSEFGGGKLVFIGGASLRAWQAAQELSDIYHIDSRNIVYLELPRKAPVSTEQIHQYLKLKGVFNAKLPVAVFDNRSDTGATFTRVEKAIHLQDPDIRVIFRLMDSADGDSWAMGDLSRQQVNTTATFFERNNWTGRDIRTKELVGYQKQDLRIVPIYLDFSEINSFLLMTNPSINIFDIDDNLWSSQLLPILQIVRQWLAIHGLTKALATADRQREALRELVRVNPFMDALRQDSLFKDLLAKEMEELRLNPNTGSPNERRLRKAIWRFLSHKDFKLHVVPVSKSRFSSVPSKVFYTDDIRSCVGVAVKGQGSHGTPGIGLFHLCYPSPGKHTSVAAQTDEFIAKLKKRKTDRLKVVLYYSKERRSDPSGRFNRIVKALKRKIIAAIPDAKVVILEANGLTGSSHHRQTPTLMAVDRDGVLIAHESGEAWSQYYDWDSDFGDDTAGARMAEEKRGGSGPTDDGLRQWVLRVSGMTRTWDLPGSTSASFVRAAQKILEYVTAYPDQITHAWDFVKRNRGAESGNGPVTSKNLKDARWQSLALALEDKLKASPPVGQFDLNRRSFVGGIFRAAVAFMMPHNPLGGALFGPSPLMKITTEAGRRAMDRMDRMIAKGPADGDTGMKLRYWAPIVAAELEGRAGVHFGDGYDEPVLPRVAKWFDARPNLFPANRQAFWDEFSQDEPFAKMMDYQNISMTMLEHAVLAAGTGKQLTVTEEEARKMVGAMNYFFAGGDGGLFDDWLRSATKNYADQVLVHPWVSGDGQIVGGEQLKGGENAEAASLPGEPGIADLPRPSLQDASPLELEDVLAHVRWTGDGGESNFPSLTSGARMAEDYVGTREPFVLPGVMPVRAHHVSVILASWARKFYVTVNPERDVKVVEFTIEYPGGSKQLMLRRGTLKSDLFKRMDNLLRGVVDKNEDALWKVKSSFSEKDGKIQIKLSRQARTEGARMAEGVEVFLAEVAGAREARIRMLGVAEAPVNGDAGGTDVFELSFGGEEVDGGVGQWRLREAEEWVGLGGGRVLGDRFSGGFDSSGVPDVLRGYAARNDNGGHDDAGGRDSAVMARDKDGDAEAEFERETALAEDVLKRAGGVQEIRPVMVEMDVTGLADRVDDVDKGEFVKRLGRALEAIHALGLASFRFVGAEDGGLGLPVFADNGGPTVRLWNLEDFDKLRPTTGLNLPFLQGENQFIPLLASVAYANLLGHADRRPDGTPRNAAEMIDYLSRLTGNEFTPSDIEKLGMLFRFDPTVPKDAYRTVAVKPIEIRAAIEMILYLQNLRRRAVELSA